MSRPRYIEVDPRSRVLVLVLFAVAMIGAFALHLAIEHTGIAQAVTQEAARDAAQQLRSLMLIVGVVGCVLATFASWYLSRLGLRVLRSGQFPPPGTAVARRTRVRSAAAAKKMAWLSFVMAALVWLPVALTAWIVVLVEQISE